MKKLIAITMISAFMLIGCQGEPYTNVDNVGENSISAYTTLIDGNLYYIERGDSNMDFPKSYKTFLNENTDLEILDVESDPNLSSNNSTKGYFIFTKPIK